MALTNEKYKVYAKEPRVRTWLYYEYNDGYGAHSGGKTPEYFYINKLDYDSPTTWKHVWLNRLARMKLIKLIPMSDSTATGVNDIITVSDIIKLDASAIEDYFNDYDADAGQNTEFATAVYNAEITGNNRTEVLTFLDNKYSINEPN